MATSENAVGLQFSLFYIFRVALSHFSRNSEMIRWNINGQTEKGDKTSHEQ